MRSSEWRLLDALAEYVTEPAQLLARDASGDSQLSSVQTRLNETAAAVVGTLARSKRLRADETHALFRRRRRSTPRASVASSVSRNDGSEPLRASVPRRRQGMDWDAGAYESTP